MPDNKINISIYSLAVLPVDYLERTGDPFETVCAVQGMDLSCRHVFSAGIRAYQLTTYLELVRERYGRGVANQIGHYQRRLLQPGSAGPNAITTAIDLVCGALESKSVTADTSHGSIDIPIEMNIALALLLGMPGSPHFAARAEQRAAQVTSMGMDLDWSLSQCLIHAREEIKKIFSPLLACVDSGVHIEYVQTWLNEKCPANKAGYQ